MRYHFKARCGEAAEDNDCTGSNTPDGLVDPNPYAIDTDGVEYCLHAAPVWSRRSDRYLDFDPDTPVRKLLTLYTYYENNRAESNDARRQPDEVTHRTTRIVDDFFLKWREAADLVDGVHGVAGRPGLYGIHDALAVFEQTAPRASLVELQVMSNSILQTLVQCDDILSSRRRRYDVQ